MTNVYHLVAYNRYDGAKITLCNQFVVGMFITSLHITNKFHKATCKACRKKFLKISEHYSKMK